jgi:hypothetical protein
MKATCSCEMTGYLRVTWHTNSEYRTLLDYICIHTHRVEAFVWHLPSCRDHRGFDLCAGVVISTCFHRQAVFGTLWTKNYIKIVKLIFIAKFIWQAPDHKIQRFQCFTEALETSTAKLHVTQLITCGYWRIDLVITGYNIYPCSLFAILIHVKVGDILLDVCRHT